ncbi:MAG: SPOR domain-containing protein [Candidatus Hydrogenedentota bacterium]
MPPAKKPRKSNKATAGSQYTAELSSSQLVVGITVLMIFGLACFLFGVLIGKFDPSLQQQQVAQTSDPPTADATTPSPTSSKTPPAKSSKAEPVQSKLTSVPVTEKTIVVSRTPVEKPVIDAPQVPLSAQPTSNEPATPAVTESKPPTPTAQPKVDIPVDTPTNKIKVATTNKPSTTPPTTPVKPAKPESSTWSVQIAAFKIRSNAEAEQTRLKKRLPHTIEIYKPAGSIWTKLLVGSYATRTEADQMRKKLVSDYALVEPGLFERK